MKYIMIVIATVHAGSPIARADVVRYTNFANWQNAVAGNYSTIDFTGWPQFTVITTQFSHLGIQFVDGDDYAWQNQIFTDGAGMESSVTGNGIGIAFTTDQYFIGFQFFGDVIVTLLSHGAPVYTSNLFWDGISPFGGLVSTQPFDGVVLFDPGDPVVVIDNLYFGPPIPAPGAMALMGVALLTHRRRGRQSV